jgi:hypothetical protein
VAPGGDGPPFGAETAPDPDRATIRDKLARYHVGEFYRGVFILDPTDAPADVERLVSRVRAAMGEEQTTVTPRSDSGPTAWGNDRVCPRASVGPPRD